jgi:hypothetical protein
LIHDPAFYLAPVPYVYESSLQFDGLDSPHVKDSWDVKTDRTLERKVGHSGWYTDDEIQDETIRPAVVELVRFPGILFAATIESMGGMVSVDLSTWEAVDFTDCRDDYDAGTARHDTASSVIESADSIAQGLAEDEREYQAKWRKENDLEMALVTLAALRQSIRTLCKELKALCPGALPAQFPAAASAVRASLARMLDERRETMETAARLREELA